MPFSTHYYVLSLGTRTSTLFEAFRDALISVENQGFPVVAPGVTSRPADRDQLSSLKALGYRLWDEERRKLVGFSYVSVYLGNQYAQAGPRKGQKA